MLMFIFYFFFQLHYKKFYKSEAEDDFRLKIYLDNNHKINKHNERFERGEVTFKLAPNKYADMLNHEFVATLNGFNKSTESK